MPNKSYAVASAWTLAPVWTPAPVVPDAHAAACPTDYTHPYAFVAVVGLRMLPYLLPCCYC
jgi:hypothetical protein